MSAPTDSIRVLLTDHPWPDVAIEQEILSRAGFELIAGPVEAPDSAIVESLVKTYQPQAIMCCWAPVSQQAIESAQGLRIVSRMGVGLDNIAVAAATARGAWVANVPDYCVEEVSDHAIAMLLDHWRGITAFDRESKQSRWNPASAKLKRVRNMTVGIVGFGRIGKATARKLSEGFGAKVLAYSPSLLATFADGTEISPGVKASSLSFLQDNADAIVLHLPLTSSSKHIIDPAFLSALKRKPFIVNVSRGGLIDNAALIHALNVGAISGAALDVVDGEPNPSPQILHRDDVIVTPHVAFSSDASLAELRQRCTEEVVRVLKGEAPLHPCNQPI